MYKIGVILVTVLVGITTGYFILAANQNNFEKLSSQEKYELIIAQRDFAINEAVENGDYHCCIDPPCTMCYMEANKWNNYQAGTCACDDLIAQGKESCPQCHQEDSDNEEGGATCDFKLE